MTPLASYLAGQVVARPKYRQHMWAIPENVKILRRGLEDVHCFEVTQCLPLLDELAGKLNDQPPDKFDAILETYSFLPAPKTWIEWSFANGRRAAFLLEEQQLEGIKAKCTLYCREEATALGVISAHSAMPLGEPIIPKWLAKTTIELFGGDGPVDTGLLTLVHMFLILINSPKIIGRRQVMPNKGLERKLTQDLGAGKFPLHAWTEILLRVNKPPEIDDGEPHEAHLTGRRALHFVRKHIRIRLGQLEYVTSHWRGDPALGIKQSRYIVTP